MSLQTLVDIFRVEAGYIFWAAVYYAFVVYPVIWLRRRKG